MIQTEPPGGGEVGRTSGLTPLKAAFGGQLTPQGVGTHGVEAPDRSGTHKGGWGGDSHSLSIEVGHSQRHKGMPHAGTNNVYIINYKSIK